MKILQIFGVVAAVHAGLFLFLFAVPGCRSTGKSGAAQQPPAVVDAGTAPAYSSEPLTPSLVQSSSSLDDASLNPAFAPASAPSVSSAPGRYTPTRPGSAAVSAQAPEVQPASTYTVVKGDSLWAIAKKHGITVAELAAANNLSSKAGVRIGQTLIVPGGVDDEPAAAASFSAPAAGGTNYTVLPGDTLSGIAKKQGTTVNALRKANSLSSDMLRAGQSLIIPASAPAPVAAESTPAPDATGSLTHKVMPGETLGVIARKYNVSVGELATANSITDPTKLRAGQSLSIPGWQTPAAAASAAKTVAKPAPAPAPALFTTEPVVPSSLIPEPIVPETVEATPLTPVETVEPTEPVLVPVVPVEDSTEAPRVY